MFDIELYTNTSDEQVVDKTITLLGSVQGELREDSGILNPTIKLEYEGVPLFNYAKIPAFGNRYYFVEGEPVSLTYNIWQINFRHDPLMNLKGQFRNLTGLIERQEHNYNAYLTDGTAPVEADSKLYIVSGLNWTGGNSFNIHKNVAILSSTACGTN